MIWPWRRSRPRPDAPFVAVGDIHGRSDLLERVLDRAAVPVVCVGDYVDRGPDSAGVLRRLAARPDVTCLMGNHEQMLLGFLDTPTGSGGRWLRYGGVQTLESFGVTAVETRPVAELRDALAEAMGPALIEWLRALPSSWRSGNVGVVHAGADPDRPLDDQDPAVLHWGHPRFPRRARRDGAWVIHGHVIVDAPLLQGRVASIDTGAWATDRLTMAHVAEGEIRFETA